MTRPIQPGERGIPTPATSAAASPVAHAPSGPRQNSGAPVVRDGYSPAPSRVAQAVITLPAPPAPQRRVLLPASDADAMEAKLAQAAKAAEAARTPNNPRAAAEAARAAQIYDDVARRMDVVRRTPQGTLGDDHIAHMLFARARVERVSLAVQTGQVGSIDVDVAPNGMSVSSSIIADAREAAEAYLAAVRALETPQARAEMGERHQRVWQAVRQEAVAAVGRVQVDAGLFASGVAMAAMSAFEPARNLSLVPNQEAIRRAIGVERPGVLAELDRSVRQQGGQPLTPRAWISAWSAWAASARGPNAPPMVVNAFDSSRQALESAASAELDRPFAR